MSWQLRMALTVVIVVAGVDLVSGTAISSAAAAVSRPPIVQVQVGPGVGAETPSGGKSVTRGMDKEAVRTAWGKPEEIRKIRTCFGWQEEWVYRGDPKRFGGEERLLLFDEGEVLVEIK